MNKVDVASIRGILSLHKDELLDHPLPSRIVELYELIVSMEVRNEKVLASMGTMRSLLYKILYAKPEQTKEDLMELVKAVLQKV